MSNELAVVEDPKMSMARGRDTASVCREVVLKHSQVINGNKHVKIEGWQTIAAAWGCTPGIESIEVDERGARAKAYLRRDSDGVILSTAFGYCSRTEKFGKEDHSVEGMAQTRAMSRVCANKFRFVVVMIDPNLSATPAEEMVNLQGGNKEGAGTRDVAAAPSGPVQTLTGRLTRVSFNERSGYFNGEVKGIRFGTQDAEIGEDLKALNGTEVTIQLEEKTSKGGKAWYLLKNVQAVETESDQSEPFFESNEP